MNDKKYHVYLFRLIVNWFNHIFFQQLINKYVIEQSVIAICKKKWEAMLMGKNTKNAEK